jgi:hypothetical protein
MKKKVTCEIMGYTKEKKKKRNWELMQDGGKKKPVKFSKT